MKKITHSKKKSFSKRIILLSITLLMLFSLKAQVPLGHYAIFDFTGGSLNNTSVSANFNGSALATIDRFNVAGNAIITSGNLTGVSLGTANFNSSTLSFWIKTGPLTTTKRIIQMYGTGGNGYRVEIDGTNINVNGSATASTQLGQVFSGTYNLDDNTWHHIAVRTTSVVNDTEIKFELFVDGALTTTGGNIDPSGIVINNFLNNATLVADPLNSYNASIDDIYMYKTALTDAEILQLYNLQPPASLVYVDIDATGNNDGSSWADAYTDVRTAFINATGGQEIWVAEGKYIRQNITDRNAVFGWTADYLKVYGGFNGTETMLSQRDWRANETILSGDIGTAGINSDNSYTVVAGPFGTSANPINYSLIDGFTIQEGNANASTSGNGDRGAGFLLQDYVKEVEIINCVFTDNIAKFGGGVFASSGTTSDAKVIVDACIFKNNESRYGSAAMLVTNGQDFESEVSNSLFYNNETRDFGTEEGGSGVVYVQQQNHFDIDVKLSNLTIANNANNGTSAGNNYGSILFFKHNASSGTGNLRIDNCIVWGNPGDIKSVARNTAGTNLNSITINNMITEENFGLNIGNLTTSNILYSNPLFTDSTNNIFTLQSSSPAVDAGTQVGLTLSALDLAGNPRVNGSEVDLGCYEFTCAQFTFQITENNGVLSAPTNFVSYQWSFGGNDIAGATSATYTPTESGLYTLEVSDGNCPKTKPYFFCSTDLLTLFENNGILTAPSGFDGYEWFLDGVLISGASNATYATTQDGAYYCEATTIVPNSISICTQTTATVSICSSVSVDITESNGTLTATAGYTDYQWFKDGVAISGAQNDTYAASENGDYYCNATENGCTSSSNTISITGVSIQDLNFDKVRVYPNPTSGVINLDVEETLTSIRIMDISGRTIQAYNPEQTQVDIASFTNGIYFLKIANAEKKSVVKIIKK